MYGGGAISVIALTPILLGFGTAGVGAATAAAGIQAGIGNVAAGSLFATATSLAMKGAFVKLLLAGSASAATGVGIKLKGTKKEEIKSE